MKYQQGQDREQLHIFPVTMESSIGAGVVNTPKNSQV